MQPIVDEYRMNKFRAYFYLSPQLAGFGNSEWEAIADLQNKIVELINLHVKKS